MCVYFMCTWCVCVCTFCPWCHKSPHMYRYVGGGPRRECCSCFLTSWYMEDLTCWELWSELFCSISLTPWWHLPHPLMTPPSPPDDPPSPPDDTPSSPDDTSLTPWWHLPHTLKAEVMSTEVFCILLIALWWIWNMTQWLREWTCSLRSLTLTHLWSSSVARNTKHTSG